MRLRSFRSAALVLAGLILFNRTLMAQDAQSRLWDAAIAGDTVALARAITDGAKVDSLDVRRSPNGRRALNWAALGNHVPAIRMLLASGASINATNLTGFTPAHHAAEAGSADAMKFLIEAGADVTIPNTAGAFPIDTAREHGHVAVIALLESAGKKNN